MTNWKERCAELTEALCGYTLSQYDCLLVDRTRAALAQPEPETPRLRYCDVHGQQPENAWGCPECVREMRHQLAQPELEGPTVIGPEWQPCVKLPITVHVREQRPAETHSSTREGITPLRPDDLIMRGVQGEEYPIGRELFNQTYRMGATLAQPEPAVAGLGDDAIAADFRSWYNERYHHHYFGAIPLVECIEWTRYALTRYTTPQPSPVPVAERLPGPDDCDEDGFCWFWNLQWERWMAGWQDDECTHWLPAHAIPLPQGGEVEV